MRGQERIEGLFAVLAVDDDDTEGVCAFMTPGGLMPMIGADEARLARLIPHAKKLASMKGRAVEVVRFTVRQSVRWIKPGRFADDDDDDEILVEHTGESLRVGYRQFQEPVVAERPIRRAVGIVVKAALVDGAPAIAVDYEMEDGTTLENVTVVGEQAEDLARMAAQALATLRRTQN